MLPAEFQDLQPWVAQWGLADPQARLRLRSASTLAELEAFHRAIVPRLEAIIEHLNRYRLDAIPEHLQPLAWTALAACEVDDAVRLWQAPVLDHADDPGRWRVKAHFNDYR